MFASFIDIVDDIALGPQRRKVKRYLNAATCDTVSADLGKVLSSQLDGWRERELLQTTFDKYCIEDSSQQKYWNEESFRNHIRSTHSTAAVSDPAIRLLWGSFHFYAFHPFPRDLQHAKVDFDAFKRAVLLTVFQCDYLLGTREFDWFWRNDACFFREAGFKRIFRSIGVLGTTAQAEPPQQGNDMTCIVSDAMDVLVMIGPQFIHAVPSQEQLEGVARKLFTGGPAVAQRTLTRKEVSVLVSLMLRMRLEEEKWGSSYNFGDITQASPADEGLTEALVSCLAGDKHERTITSEQLLGAINLLPNFQLRFHQLWAILFQPSIAAAKAKSSYAPEAAPTYISAAISLFAPHFETEGGYRQTISKQDTRIALQQAQILPNSQNTTIARLVKGLSHHSSAYVVLFTSDAIGTAPEAAVGAYFPSPLLVADAEAENRKRETRGNTPHLLFQLQPTFRLLRWTKPDVPVVDLIKIDGNKLSLEEIASTEGLDSLNVPYWIGDPTGQGTGLGIDPEKKTATLTGGGEERHRDMKVGGKDGFGENWEVTIQNPRMDIFTVTSVVDRKS
ncbi:hypothetical protein F4779DRAFT_347726 [Xylariaceae sp. FL0662B]|nr:hypothetical protein F4779DRAFT_347726 [Xylariaceae sp. FL0662B]